jgi:hypothetical protein
MSETPEQKAALDALETKIDALTPEQRAALETYLVANHPAPQSATEAVALIPKIEAAIHVVTGRSAVRGRIHNPAQTDGAVMPLQSATR